MLDRSKTDPYLGERIHRVLLEAGVETPFNPDGVPSMDQMQVISESVHRILYVLGLDLKDDSLTDTPSRIAKMYLNDLYWGLDYNNFPKTTVIDNKMQYQNMMLERHISVKSTCEHHLLPFLGEAFIAYLPDEKIIGLSKLNRVVEFFSRRPQVQERLTEQIYYTLVELLGTESVAVVIQAQHSCVRVRGVEDINSDTVTSRLGGAFLDRAALRDEFYQAIRL